MFGMFLVMVDTFYTAYLTEEKQVIVAIDEYNEAHIEAIIVMPFVGITGLIATVFIINNYIKGKKNE